MLLALALSGAASGAIVLLLAWPLSAYLMKLDQAFCAGGETFGCGLGWRRAYQIMGLDTLAVAGIAFLLMILVFARRRWLFLVPPGLAIVTGLFLGPAREVGANMGADAPPLFFAQPYFVSTLESFRWVIVERYDPSWKWSAPIWMEHRVLWGAGLWIAILLPATALAVLGRGRETFGADRLKPFGWLGVAAAAAACYAGVLFAVATLIGLPGHEYPGAGMYALSRWSPAALAVWCFSYGAVLGRRRPWWPWLHLGVPFLTVPVLLRLVAHTDIVWPAEEAIPAVAGVALYVPFVVIGACWEPLAEKVALYRKRLRGSELTATPVD